MTKEQEEALMKKRNARSVKISGRKNSRKGISA